MHNIVRLGFALALLPLAACNPPNRVNPVSSTIPQPVPFGPSVSAPDTQFAGQASRSDLFEISTSQMALQKARRPGVRQYAQQMIDHHTATTRQLQSLASAKGITLPGSLEPQQQQIVAALDSASPGASFERQYLAGQIDGHVATVSTYRSQIAGGTDPDLRAMAEQNLPEIERHLADARRLAGVR